MTTEFSFSISRVCSSKKLNSVINYLPSCHSKPVIALLIYGMRRGDLVNGYRRLTQKRRNC